MATTNEQKIELFKDGIFKLYSQEGRTKTYIAKMLGVPRKLVAKKIDEWKFPKGQVRRLTPSTQKFINKNRAKILSKLNNDVPITDIAKDLDITRKALYYYIENDNDLKDAFREYAERKTHRKSKIEKAIEKSSREYNIVDMPGEMWKDIEGYPRYMVSNMGRVKSWAKNYKAYYLLRQGLNEITNRYYVNLVRGEKVENLQVARLVAHAFVDGYTADEKNSVNHKDGNPLNNRFDNLEWVSYADTQRSGNVEKFDAKKIIYDGKYEFATVTALAKFLGISRAMAFSYLLEPDKHNLKIIRD